MPPRHAYWTIIIDNAPTAFRAREREDLLPTLNQLRRTNKDVLLKWFGRGKLWDTPEAAQTAGHEPTGTREKRGRDWRPGGAHKDPRDRFKKGGKRRDDRPKTQTTSEKGPDTPRGTLPTGAQPWRDKPRGTPPAGAPPWRGRPDTRHDGGGAPPRHHAPLPDATSDPRHAQPKKLEEPRTKKPNSPGRR